MPAVPANWKITFFLQQGTYGWSESWYSAQSLDSIALITPQVNRYWTLRSRTLANEGLVTWARIVALTARPRIQTVIAFNNQAVNTGQIPSESDAPFTSVLYRCWNNGQTRWKNWYVRGIPDNCVTNGGQFNPTAAFKKAFADLVELISSNPWGWQGLFASQAWPITNVVQNGPANCPIITAPTAALPAANTPNFTARISGVVGAVEVNGQHVFVPINATSCQMLRPTAIFPYQANGTIRYSPLTYIQLLDVEPLRVVERRAGRPSYQSRGRRSARR